MCVGAGRGRHSGRDRCLVWGQAPGLLTGDEEQPVDVFVEVIQDLAVHGGRVAGGHQVLLGPLELAVEPRHTVLQ